MTTFVALYRGLTVGDAKLVAVSADPELVVYMAARMLKNQKMPTDPALRKLDQGRRGALRVLRNEAREEPTPPAP